MEKNNVNEATEVWVLLNYSLGETVDEGLNALGVFDAYEKGQIALARHYEKSVKENDEDEIFELYYIKSTHLCNIVPKST